MKQVPVPGSEIDISPLKRALLRLEEGLAQWHADEPNTLLRDGVIQRFEFTYELSHRTLKRFLESDSANPELIAALSFQDLIRTGSDRGVLRSSWTSWRSFRQARSETSHTYDESKSKQVLGLIPEFVLEVRAMILSMEERLGR